MLLRGLGMISLNYTYSIFNLQFLHISLVNSGGRATLVQGHLTLLCWKITVSMYCFLKKYIHDMLNPLGFFLCSLYLDSL